MHSQTQNSGTMYLFLAYIDHSHLIDGKGKYMFVHSDSIFVTQ